MTTQSLVTRVILGCLMVCLCKACQCPKPDIRWTFCEVDVVIQAKITSWEEKGYIQHYTFETLTTYIDKTKGGLSTNKLETYPGYWCGFSGEIGQTYIIFAKQDVNADGETILDTSYCLGTVGQSNYEYDDVLQAVENHPGCI